MKSKFIHLLIPFALCIWIVSCQTQANETKPPVDVNQEKELIKTAITTLTTAHANSDADAWLGQWVPEPYVFISAADSGGHFFVKNYDTLAALYNRFWPKNYDGPPRPRVTLEPYDFFIRVCDTMATAEFKIKWEGKMTIDDSVFVRNWETYENYSMEKRSDDWKVASISAVGLTSYQRE
ncbi:hypothetical protein [Marinoscillum sp. MHG1-6]|uniref:hypothetical protein n=1 Tax=Marinoscillum sp. MHG1-6 TaxID=2959627 RepID=UPI0021574B04|nr:hypothetical protein [Marinoscillum sp. MHG1-6]